MIEAEPKAKILTMSRTTEGGAEISVASEIILANAREKQRVAGSMEAAVQYTSR